MQKWDTPTYFAKYNKNNKTYQFGQQGRRRRSAQSMTHDRIPERFKKVQLKGQF
jgi:hypothetical protein